LKKIALILSLIFISTDSFSKEDDKLISIYESAQTSCKLLETIAFNAQIERQLGKRPSEAVDFLMNMISDEESISQELKDEIYQNIFNVVEHAFHEPMHKNEAELQQIPFTYSNGVISSLMELMMPFFR
jgi:glucose-6-phosphate-specific signal transduction histidine kinase